MYIFKATYLDTERANLGACERRTQKIEVDDCLFDCDEKAIYIHAMAEACDHIKPGECLELVEFIAG